MYKRTYVQTYICMHVCMCARNFISTTLCCEERKKSFAAKTECKKFEINANSILPKLYSRANLTHPTRAWGQYYSNYFAAFRQKVFFLQHNVKIPFCEYFFL
jgi:hypothetical protein